MSFTILSESSEIWGGCEISQQYLLQEMCIKM